MEQSQHNTTEVLIVGAGPTGLMMACQLAFHRVSFRIIDKKAESSHNSGALIVQARTLEIFEQLGLANEAVKHGIVADKIEIQYNRQKIAGTSIKDIGSNLSQFPFLLMLEQSQTEKLLLKFLEERGCFVERNVEFKKFAEVPDGIITNVAMPDGSGQTIISKYLIGADGSKSDLRSFLNIPFKGVTYSRPIYILDCGEISEITTGVIYFAFSGKSVAGLFPLKNQRWRVDGSVSGKVKESDNITLESVTKELQNRNNLSFTLKDNEWFSVSHSQQKYADSIQIGNCFFAGDSAHVNTPVGAQGMNTGLQDAHNLAWKLAFVLRHKAKPELLSSYSTERLGISKGFARYADVIFRLFTNTNTGVALFRTIALKTYFKRIFPRQVNNQKSRLSFFKAISQIDIHYKTTYKDSENLFLSGAPKPGYRLPYVEFVYNDKKANSHQILSKYDLTLLVFADELTPEIKLISERYKLEAVLLKRQPETDNIYASLGITETGYYLIRPDMYIGIRSATLEPCNLNFYLEKSGYKYTNEHIIT